MKQVWILVNYNLYDTKKYFAEHLRAAFQRRGIHVRLIDVRNRPLANLQQSFPDLVCSFNRTLPDEKGKFFWDYYQFPFLSILVDPALYDSFLIQSPLSYLSCVDEFDVEFLKKQGFERAFFWPHAVEKELAAPPDQKRPFEVTFFGSSYDPEGLRKAWQKNYSPEMQKLIEEAVEITLSEDETPFWEAVKRLNCNPKDFLNICTIVDNYVRGVDRLELIRAVAKIPGIKVHLFGGCCWRKETPIMGWNHYFGGNPQIVIHPSIPYPEALEIMKQSKICLNSSPFFKRGSHERILAALACGSVSVTTESSWTRSQFVDGEELLLYRPKKWTQVTDKIAHFLNDEPARQAAATKGRAKVMAHHTWDNRVVELIAFWERMRPAS